MSPCLLQNRGSKIQVLTIQTTSISGNRMIANSIIGALSDYWSHCSGGRLLHVNTSTPSDLSSPSACAGWILHDNFRTGILISTDGICPCLRFQKDRDGP